MASTSELGLSSSDKKIIVIGGALIGFIVGLALPYIWNFIEQFDDLPFHSVLSFVMSLHLDWMSLIRPLFFAFVGLGLAILILAITPRVVVSSEKIEIYKGKNRRIIKRSQVSGMYLEGSSLIIESDKGRRLFSGNIEGGKKRIAKTFTNYGYPWES